MENTPDTVSRRSVLGLVGSAALTGMAGCAAVEPPQTGGEPTATTPTNSSIDTGRFEQLFEAVSTAAVEIRVTDETEFGPMEAGGSGFAIDGGSIVTNAHVVMEESHVEIRYHEETWGEGTVVGTDLHSDLAVVHPADPPADLGSVSFIEGFPSIGEEVMAIGAPLGFGGSASTGIVSGIDRSLPSPSGFSVPAAIQTDAAVNPGNSGGPLVNLAGDVIGVVFAGAAENIGFAISAPISNRVIPVLDRGATYEHSYLGVQLMDVTPRIADANNAAIDAGVYIDSIVEDGPAASVLEGSADEEIRDGEQIPIGGDIIRGMNGTDIPHMDALSAFLALETEPGEELVIDIIREGTEQTVDLTLGARPESAEEVP